MGRENFFCAGFNFPTGYVTPELFNTSGIKILEGRNLNETDSGMGLRLKLSMFLSQGLWKTDGYRKCFGKTFRYEGDNSGVRDTEVGVVSDYVYEQHVWKTWSCIVCMYGSLNRNTTGNVPAYQTADKYRTGTWKDPSADTKCSKKLTLLTRSITILSMINSILCFWQGEILIGKLSQVLLRSAIFISCLGLFGLAAYTAERRTKEIGIRKVLGSSISGIAALLSKDFLKLVGLVVPCCFSCRLVDDE